MSTHTLPIAFSLACLVTGIGTTSPRAADLPAGPDAAVPPAGKAPGDYPNFTVTAANWVMDASAVTDITGGLRDEVKMTLAGQGPLPWSLTEFGQGRFAPRLNVGDPQAAASNLGKLPFDLIIDGSAYQWENDLDPWAPNGAAWRPHPAKGILLATIRKNGQSWNDGSAPFFGVVSTPVEQSGGEGYSLIDGSFGPGDVEVAVGKAGALSRGSLDTSVAWFPYDQGWIGGHVASADFEEGEWYRDGLHHPDLPADPLKMITWSRDLGVIVPPVTLSLPDINARTDGMLFTLSIEMGDSNTRLTSANPKADGSGWEIMIRSDNNPDFDFPEESGLAFSFLYVPYTSNRLIGGHIRGSDANVINGRGNYTIKRLATGRYELAIPGKKSSDGMLLLGAAGTVPGRNNILSRAFLSYEATAEDRFLIESRFYQSESDQPLENSDFYFAWVDFAQPLSPPGFETVTEPPTIATPPSSMSVELGAEVNFEVSATGTEPFIYQWLYNGAAIDGATEPSYRIATASLDHAGTYVVEVTNGGGKAVSEGAILKVLAPPNITTQPQSLDAAVGDTVRFVVEAGGTPPLTYQWQKDGVDIPGANAAELILNSIGIEAAGQYRAKVSNEVKDEFSLTGRLTVRAIVSPPAITQQPNDADVNTGDPVSFQVLASGSPPLAYQWQFNQQDLPGATTDTFRIPTATLANAGLYRVRVSNSSGAVASREARLNVAEPPPTIAAPQINQQPAAVTVTSGESARFQVIASGQSLSFQWQKNGVNLPGANQSSLAFASTTASDAGSYRVIVTNPGGTVSSNPAALTVNAAPPPSANLTITTQPASQTVAPGDNVSFSIEAQGAGALTFQWQLGNFNIPGARSSSFTIENVQVVDEGNYRVVISDGTTTLTSEPAILTVSNAPVITRQPESQSITEGDTVTFSVEATGQAPLTYQWRYQGVNIPGARNRQFTLAGVQPPDAGPYQVVVSDSAGSTVSEIAELTVLDRPAQTLLSIDRISVSGNTLLIEWQGGPGIVLQAKAKLDDPAWLDIPGSEGQNSIQQLALGLTAYFRLIQR